MKNKTYTIGLIVVAIIAIGAYLKPQSKALVQNTLGNVSTLNSVDSPNVSIGGVEYYYYSQGMIASSSVVCSLRNPFNAPAMLLNYSAYGTTTSTTAGGLGSQLMDLATSTTAYGTSSPAFVKEVSVPVTAGLARWSFGWLQQASTTNARIIGMEPTGGVGNTQAILGSAEYLNLRISTTSTSGTFGTYESGKCSGVLKKL